MKFSVKICQVFVLGLFVSCSVQPEGSNLSDEEAIDGTKERVISCRDASLMDDGFHVEFTLGSTTSGVVSVLNIAGPRKVADLHDKCNVLTFPELKSFCTPAESMPSFTAVLHNGNGEGKPMRATLTQLGPNETPLKYALNDCTLREIEVKEKADTLRCVGVNKKAPRDVVEFRFNGTDFVEAKLTEDNQAVSIIGSSEQPSQCNRPEGMAKTTLSFCDRSSDFNGYSMHLESYTSENKTVIVQETVDQKVVASQDFIGCEWVK